MNAAPSFYRQYKSMTQQCRHAATNAPGSECPNCGSITEVCFKPPVVEKDPARPTANDGHDVQLLSGEPGFTIAARDSGSWFWPELYACRRLRDWSGFDAIVANLKAEADATPAEPHKDAAHAWSARARATEMMEWRNANMATKPVRGRVNNTPEAGVGGEDASALLNPFEIEALRRARPDPAEVHEGS